MPSYAEETREATGGRMGRLLRPYGVRLISVMLLLGLLAVTNMALPYIVKRLIDDVFPHVDGGGGDWRLLWVILPAIVLIYVLRNVLFFSSRMLSVRISEDVCFSLRKRLFDHLQQLSLRFYKSNQPGKISSRVMDDTFKIQSFIQEKLPTLTLNLLMFLVLLVILYRVNPALAAASTVVLPLHFAAYHFFRLPIKRSHSEAQENLASAYSNVVEKFLGMEVVKGFTAERRESDRFHDALDASRQSQIRSSRFQFGQKVVADLLVGVGTVLLFGFGAWQVMNGRMTAGDFFMFFGYVGMLYPAVLEVISGLGHFSKTTASVDRVYEMLDEPTPEMTLGEDKQEVIDTDFTGAIDFRNIRFAFEDGHSILRDLTFSIEKGEHIAITGPSGSGKTTAVSLLPRFLVPDSGEVRIDGVNVLDYPIKPLRNGIGIAFQEVFLFNASIYENLRYARPTATPDEIVEACRLTGAHDFIKRLPHGYKTKIGEAGAELSRGEKQRLTLARALIKDPRILILDEATASIDSASAREIIQKIFSRLEDRTVIMVTHETDLLDLADRIVSIHRGQIEFDGPPDAYEGFEPARDLNEDTAEIPIVDTSFLGLTSPAGAGKEARGAEHGKPRGKPWGGGMASAILLGVLLLIGCVSDSKVAKSVEFDDPKSSAGWLNDEPERADELDRIDRALAEREVRAARDRAAAMDKTEEPPFDPVRLSAELERRLDQLNLGLISQPEENEGADAATAETDSSEPLVDTSNEPRDEAPGGSLVFPPESARLVDLPRLSETELTELVESLSLKMQTELGYQPASPTRQATLPAPPSGVHEVSTLVLAQDGAQRIMRLGYRSFLSQPPRLWITGGSIASEQVDPNPDVETLSAAIQPMIDALTQMRATMTSGDLEVKLVQLNYAEPSYAMVALKALGVTTFPDVSGVPANLNFDQLPVVVAMPALSDDQVGLVGDVKAGGGQYELSISPTTASKLHQNTIATPVNQLIVLFHPAHPEQFSLVRQLLDDVVDRKARQIFVEGMVLEISEDGLEDLGIEWSYEEGPVDFILGSLRAGSIFDTFEFTRFDSRDFDRDWAVRIRALIREGKAEILSRPSVLTLNGRQATIRVGQDVPIATSQEGFATNTNKVAFNFKYLSTGILLNVRPRITEFGDEVSMLIDTIVSAEVPGQDLEIRSREGEVLASAPTISTRRVQTYGRIPNNTPFIIGGLVSRDNQVTTDKVPLLGDLPLIGAAFRAERNSTAKREVIIVLTPHVIEERTPVTRSLPKDTDLFDSFGNDLFRDGYRIRTGDVFDLRFLLENRRLTAYARVARQLISKNFRLRSIEPFNHFANDRIPGEEVLVHRMIYEVVKRLNASEPIDPTRIIFFGRQQDAGGYEVEFLDEELARLAGSRRSEDFFRRYPGHALAISFYYDRESLNPERLASEPVPEIELVPCTDDEWTSRLWEMNQPVGERQRYTILLHEQDDLLRLRRAILLKRIIALNGGESAVSLKNFSIGKFLLMPESQPGQTYVIDADVAKLYFHTELYYAATIQEIEKTLIAMDAALAEAGLTQLLEAAAETEELTETESN